MNSFNLCGQNPAPMTCLEVVMLKQIVRLLPKKPIIIQIGAYIGLSTMAMLEANLQVFIFSIDIKPHAEERENLTKAELPINQAIRILGDSSGVGQYWPVKCDLLFIDGDHRLPAIEADIATWLPKVKRNGLVAFHDYIEPPYTTQSRVQIAVDDLMKGYEEMLFVDRLKVFRV